MRHYKNRERLYQKLNYMNIRLSAQYEDYGKIELKAQIKDGVFGTEPNSF